MNFKSGYSSHLFLIKLIQAEQRLNKIHFSQQNIFKTLGLKLFSVELIVTDSA